MSLSVKNGGIGKSPAISRLNRFSPKKESKMISGNMRQYIQPRETSALSISNEIRAESNALWNTTAPLALKPCYPVTKVNMSSFKVCVSNMVLQPTKELGEHLNANSNAISGKIAHMSARRFFTG